MGLDMFIFNGDDEVAYWRKVNCVHRFFCERMDVPNCEKVMIEKDLLEELVVLCERVLEDNSLAKELLPTQGGCFFGSLEYDDDYFEDLEDTVVMMNKVIDDDSLDDLYYLAWW
jgi:hypothetical protein